MLSFAVLSTDILKQRYLALLCQSVGFIPAEAEKATLLLIDTDTCPPQNRPGAVAVGKDPAKANGLPFLLYPVAEETFSSFCESCLASPALSPTESRLFTLLKEANGKTVPGEVLLREAFGAGADKGILPVYIHYLRKKIETDGKKRIFSEKGKGYAYRC